MGMRVDSGEIVFETADGGAPVLSELIDALDAMPISEGRALIRVTDVRINAASERGEDGRYHPTGLFSVTVKWERKDLNE